MVASPRERAAIMVQEAMRRKMRLAAQGKQQVVVGAGGAAGGAPGGGTASPAWNQSNVPRRQRPQRRPMGKGIAAAAKITVV